MSPDTPTTQASEPFWFFPLDGNIPLCGIQPPRMQLKRFVTNVKRNLTQTRRRYQGC